MTMTRNCDICRINVGADTPATWDAPSITGPWAYMCDSHHDTHGLPGGTNLAELERRQNATFDERKDELLNALDKYTQ